jgi:hypothetical protein
LGAAPSGQKGFDSQPQDESGGQGRDWAVVGYPDFELRLLQTDEGNQVVVHVDRRKLTANGLGLPEKAACVIDAYLSRFWNAERGLFFWYSTELGISLCGVRQTSSCGN